MSKLKTSSIFEHLSELKQRILWCFLIFIVFWAVFFHFSNEIFNILIRPLSSAMQSSGGTKRMIYTNLTEGFFTHIKLAGFASLMVTMPIFLNQIWRFMSPALYKKERNALLPFFISSTGLFYLGAALVYFLIIPLAWKFFLGFQTGLGQTILPVELEARISEYLNLITSLIIAFGIAFQLPILLVLLVKAGIISSIDLIRFRRYSVVINFIIAAILTPPDVVSQISMAIPLLLLYEISIFCSKRIERK
jgi:sec-independent protein translocase protein TatC